MISSMTFPTMTTNFNSLPIITIVSIAGEEGRVDGMSDHIIIMDPMIAQIMMDNPYKTLIGIQTITTQMSYKELFLHQAIS